jgi:hypothetical protein
MRKRQEPYGSEPGIRLQVHSSIALHPARIEVDAPHVAVVLANRILPFIRLPRVLYFGYAN